MTKKRFVIQIIITMIIILWGVIIGGNSLLLYLDIPSLIFVPLLPYFIASFIYPFREQNEIIKEIFTTQGTGDRKKLEQAINFFTIQKKLVVSAIFVATFIGGIGMLEGLSDASALPRYLGVLSISIFYGVIYILVVLEPLIGISKKKLIG
ncbi:MAG: hypothetical protein JXR64_05390 [Spirochaetales bacterium]|nr:hypothetical protein [Spirochaetales bacterium]